MNPLLRISRFAWIVPLIGVAIAGVRLISQGQSDLYTQLNKQFYQPGGLTGWQLAPETYLWLGKDFLIILVASLFASAILGWLAHKQSKNDSPSKLPLILSVLAVLIALPSLATPVLLLAGLPPKEAVAVIPSVAAPSADSAKPGSFPSGKAGRYVVAPYKDNLITAQISAGGDTFDVKLPNPSGAATFNPTHIDSPNPQDALSATFSVPLSGLSTGIELRDNHAKGYLKADQFPDLTLKFTKLISHGFDAAQGTLVFSAQTSLSIMGQTLERTTQGTLRALPSDQVTAEGLPDRPTFLLTATLDLLLPETPLKEHLSAFDNTSKPIPIRAVFIIQLAE